MTKENFAFNTVFRDHVGFLSKSSVFKGTSPYHHHPWALPHVHWRMNQFTLYCTIQACTIHQSAQGPRPTYTLQATVTKLNTNCWCHQQYETERTSDRHIELLTYPTMHRTGNANFKHCGFSSRWWWHLDPSHSTRMMADNTKQIYPWPTTLGIIVPYLH